MDMAKIILDIVMWMELKRIFTELQKIKRVELTTGLNFMNDLSSNPYLVMEDTSVALVV